jgi:hypothetical protein
MQSLSAPPLIGRLSLIAESMLPVLSAVQKTHRMTVAHTAWVSLHHTIEATFAALAEPESVAHCRRASVAFDVFKWHLRVMESQRIISSKWLASITGDLSEVGKMIGGMLRRRTQAF